jgi:hypothetical protein
MPNWCQNYLVITGPAEQLNKLKKRAILWEVKDKKRIKLSDFSLKRLVPTPRALLEYEAPNRGQAGQTPAEIADTSRRLIEQYGYDDWYHWNVHNWGTKWDVEAELNETDDGTALYYNFDSAWCPPIAGLAKISQDYPELTFELRYEEGGVGFYGHAIFQNGSVQDNCHAMTFSECPSCGEPGVLEHDPYSGCQRCGS